MMVSEDENSSVFNELERQRRLEQERVKEEEKNQQPLARNQSQNDFLSIQENQSQTSEDTRTPAKDFKFSDYFSKWNVKTISVNLDNAANDDGSTLDYESESSED